MSGDLATIGFDKLEGISERLFLSISNQLNSRFSHYTPTQQLLITLCSIAVIQRLAKTIQPRWGETRREQIGRLLLNVRYIKSMYLQEKLKIAAERNAKVQEKWKLFGEAITKIPEKGWSDKEILDLLSRYVSITQKAVKDKHFSGTMYLKMLLDSSIPKDIPALANDKPASTEDVCTQISIRFKREDVCTQISIRLKKIFTIAFGETYLWNLLHSSEFGIGSFVGYQVICMVADMFGGKPENVKGFMTSGGTESLMTAARAYRNWGITTRGLEPGESVILAGKSIHAALLKAEEAYHIKVVLVKTGENDTLDLEDLKNLADQYGNRVVAIFGSAPTYPKGKIDPIREMGLIAAQLGCGMHVDCCLGGFVINYVEDKKYAFLKDPNVTSLSSDTHKNGGAAKGSSVLVTLPMPEGNEPLPEKINLSFFASYPFPDWEGGVYGTSHDPGSESCVPGITAFFAMLMIGVEGYKHIAEDIVSTTLKMKETLSKFPGKIKLFGPPDLSVVAFAVDKEWKLEDGATYALAHLMSEKGIVLNTIKGDAVHFCMTGCSVSDKKFLENFETTLRTCLDELEKLNSECKKKGMKFPGDAPMYCALDAAISPSREKLGIQEYLKNMLLGVLAAKDAVRAHVLALQNPYS